MTITTTTTTTHTHLTTTPDLLNFLLPHHQPPKPDNHEPECEPSYELPWRHWLPLCEPSYSGCETCKSTSTPKRHRLLLRPHAHHGIRWLRGLAAPKIVTDP